MKKSARFGFRLDPGTLAAWKIAAKREKLSLSAWIAKNCNSALKS